MKKALTCVVILLSFLTSFAQRPDEIFIDKIQQPQPFISVLQRLEKLHGVRFFYAPEWIDTFTIDSTYNQRSLKEVLTDICMQKGLNYEIHSGYAVIIYKNPAAIIRHEQIITRASSQRKQINEVTIGDRATLKPGTTVVHLKGRVKTREASAPVQSATISILNRDETFSTDETGSYHLALPPGNHVIEFMYRNYKEKVIDLTIYKDGSLDIELDEMPIMLREVEVSDQAIVTSRPGVVNIKMTDLKRAPTFLGEIDVIKSLQSQPGVTTVGEIASGFNVRGGGVDQNLVLFDGVPAFNTSHALGFFSAFNSDAVQNVSFYRGGIPAEYGGRVSSVLAMTGKEGNYQKWTGNGGIGIISSNATVSGPIKKDTTAFIASARSSYSDWMLKVIKSNYKDVDQSSLFFYDASVKVTHKLSQRTKLGVSAYTSKDNFSLANDTVYSWRNIMASMRVDHSLTDRLFSTATLGFGRYAYSIGEDDPKSAFDLTYDVTYPTLNLDFNYDGDHQIAFGVHNTLYNFNPGEIRATNPLSNVLSKKIAEETSLETALYLSDGFHLLKNLFIEAGLRYSVFNRFGAGVVYHYKEGSPREPENIMDSTMYPSSDIMKTYTGLEPRASIRLTLSPRSSLKFGFNRVYQYLHLVSNTAAVSPVDIWQSSNTFFKPQTGDQFSLGYYRDIRTNYSSFIIEGFYKNVKNILDFKDGAQLILNDKLETALLSGTGLSYGVEVSASQTQGRLTGTLNYTYSRSLRRFAGVYSNEVLNDGKLFPSNYDQPNVLNLNWRYSISTRHYFSGNFVYHTGRPISVPTSYYIIDGVPMSDFTERNNYRIPDYHRLDLAFIVEGNHKLKKLWEGTWIFSFYNVYSRKNTYSVFYADNGEGKLRPYKLSVVGSIIPSITYNFKF